MNNKELPDLLYNPDHKLLVDTVLEQIRCDIMNNELEPIEELLKFIPVFNLVSFLPEDLFEKFKHLLEDE